MASHLHLYTCRVPLYEVDIGQAVYHGNYYHFFEQAREALLRDAGFSYARLMEQRLHLAVVEAHCRYRQPVRYDDHLEILTRIPWIKSRSVQFHQQLILTATGKLATEATINTVCINFEGKPVPLPEEFRAALAQWQGRDS